MSDKTKRPPAVKELDWPRERALELGEAVLEMWGELLEKLPELPVNRRLDRDQVRSAVIVEVPDEPTANADLIKYLRAVLENSVYPGHPAFSAWICGAGTVPGAIADLMASALNQNLAGWPVSPAATEIEIHLTTWLAQQFGLPPGAGGMMASGGAMANLTALKIARDQKARSDVAVDGVAAAPPLAVYTSAETHGVVVRALDMLGLGRRALRLIPVGRDMRMITGDLERAIEKDLKASVQPIAIVATAGTTHTGAIDPLPQIADIAQRHDLWFHVDACYGGAAVLSPELRPLLTGIERADSISFDPHKWMYTPLPAGCVLVRQLHHLGEAFAFDTPYTYQDTERIFISGFKTMGPEFSRAFMGFKVWLSLLAHGRKAYARRIAHDVELTQYLAERIRRHEEFELHEPVSLSICCFRFVPQDLATAVDGSHDEYLDLLNSRLMTEIQLDGRVWCSNAIIHERFYLRMCCVNYRTEAEQLDLLLDVALEHGRRLHRELTSA